jgi:hypothetical protein
MFKIESPPLKEQQFNDAPPDFLEYFYLTPPPHFHFYSSNGDSQALYIRFPFGLGDCNHVKIADVIIHSGA